MQKFVKALKIFLTMFKIGLFTFGGGYAMIAIIQREIVEKQKVIDKDEFLNLIAIAESTPGPIAINSATYIGYKIAGVLGSFFATLGVVLPSFTIIFVISLFYEQFMQLEYVRYAFLGIQACVPFIIITAGVKMLIGAKKTPFNIIITSVVIVCMVLFSLLSIQFSSIYYILIGGLIGVVTYFINTLIVNKKNKQSKKEIGNDNLSNESENVVEDNSNKGDN
jgi:chromate transporter